MAKYLDNTGLTYFTEKMKEYADGKVGAVDKKVTSHIGNDQNPHKVTKTQVGLDKVDNVKQIPFSQRGAVNGVATLDAKGKVPITQIPETMRINGQSIFGSGNITVSASLYKIVDALPTKDIDITKIYLVPAESFTTNNYKTEYIYLGDPNKAYDESKWEKIGDEKTNNITPTPGGSITVDTAFNATSSNPIANKTVTTRFKAVDDALKAKVAQEDYDAKINSIDSTLKELGNKTIDVDSELKLDSTNPVQNKAVKKAVDDLDTKINNKANSTDLTAAVGRISALETDGATGVTVSGEGNGIASIKKVGKNIVATKGTFITSLAGYATQGWVNEQEFAKTSAIPSLAGYVNDVQTTGDASGNGVVNITKNDKTITVTKGTFLTKHQSLAGYVNVVQKSGTGNGIADITKNGQTITVTKGTFLTQHQSLTEYVKTVNVQEVTNGNGIASISKSGNALNVTQGAFLTGMPNGTLFEEESTTETGKGIVDVFLRGNVLCKIKGTFITKSTLGDSIDSYMKDKSYLTEDNLNEKLKETVTIKLVSDKSESDTGLIGATVTVKSGDTTVSTQTWQGSPISVKVPCDEEVTIEAGVKKMYMKPKALAYVPSPLYNREVTFTYKALSLGTYIIDKNDNFYKTTDLFQASGVAYDDALGVLLVTDSIAIVIARTVINEKAWSTGTGLVEGCTTTTDSYSTAIKDFAGAANTAAIIKKHNALDEAAASCNRYIFKNGKKGYLMSVGEALAIQANIDTIGRLLMDIDTGSGNVMSSSEDYWTSTQYDASKAYYVTMSNKRPSSSLKENRRDVVPIYSLYD